MPTASQACELKPRTDESQIPPYGTRSALTRRTQDARRRALSNAHVQETRRRLERDLALLRVLRCEWREKAAIRAVNSAHSTDTHTHHGGGSNDRIPAPYPSFLHGSDFQSGHYDSRCTRTHTLTAEPRLDANRITSIDSNLLNRIVHRFPTVLWKTIKLSTF